MLVFQEGVGADLLGFQQVDTIEAWVPLFLFSVLFGLSMDYQVFLLSRIRERYDESGNTTDAVIFGVGSTARIITGAALIIIAVFSGFARGDLVMFQQMGFGVAIALLIDATIIRSVLLPSDHEAPRRVELVLPALARVAAAAAGRGRDARRARDGRKRSDTIQSLRGPMMRQQSDVLLEDATLAELRDALEGSVLGRSDSEYDAARVCFNALVDRRPAVIARCAGAGDVATAFDFARAHGLEVAVRGGGHNPAGHCVSTAGS